MISKLGEDSPLLKYMVPSFAVGCRRPTPGNGYLEALTHNKVRVVTDTIAEIVPEGIKLSTGEVIEVDLFICATGFDISFRPRYPVRGVHGIALADQWKDRASAYMSIAIPNFPNHFSKSPLPFPTTECQLTLQCSWAPAHPSATARFSPSPSMRPSTCSA